VASLAAASAADWAAFVSGGIPAKLVQGDTTFARKPITPEQHAAYGPLVKHARAFLVNQWISQTDGARRLLEAFDAVYDQLKFRSRGLRFEDVTRKLAAGLGGRQLASVFYRLDGQIAHLLLDEFQDTSLSQWQVLEHLARACTEPACGRSFFCVGDVKQAIYGWRGGVAEIFDAVDQSLPGVGRQSLTRSFRSSPTVIDVVNRVFGNLAPNEALAEFGSARDAWAARFEPHTTAKEELAGYVCLRTAPRAADKKQQSAGTLSYAAAEIARLAKSHPGRSIGVLVRRNAAVARLIFDLRIHHEVFASEEGGNPLTDSSAVQLVLSLLRLADHPGDGPSRFHVATSPLGPAVGFESHADVSAACQLSQRVRRQLLTDGYGRTIYSWVRALAGHCGQRDLNRLLQLVALAHGYDARATLRTDDFIDYVTDRRVEDPTAADVRVMTVHQAKGLQFDIVVLPELDVDLKGQAPRVVIGRPSPTSPANKVCRYASEELRAMLPEDVQQLFERWPQQSVSESLCLLYVAMTRAIHALHMIIAPSKENEKTWPKTYAGVLRGSLAPGSKAEPERLLDEHGNASWDVTRKPSVVKLAAPSTAPLEVRLRPSTMRRELDRVSPSSLEGGARVDLARKLRPPAAAFERGSLVHAWFEAVEWSDDGIPPEPALREIARKQHFAADKLPGELKKFAAMLARPAIRAALSRAAYDDPKAGPPELKVSRERRFAVRQGDRLVTGAIDRLVEVYRGSQLVTAEILDFKTDAIADAAALAKAVEFYRPQIEAYRDAVASQTGLDRRMVAARLLFVERGECVALEPENVPGVGPK
jgi:ATP-dependent exoDNAse (exonuclease V) beta subunit